MGCVFLMYVWCLCMFIKDADGLFEYFRVMYERETDSVSCENECTFVPFSLSAMHKVSNKIGRYDLC